MPAQVCRLDEVAAPTQSEVADRFGTLYPELLSRACRIAARERDPEEAVAEIMGFSFWNYRQAAMKGRFLSAGQLAWTAMRRVRGEGASLGSRRSKTDVMSVACQRHRRANVVSLASLIERHHPGHLQEQFDEAISSHQTSIPDQVAVKLDWRALRSVLRPRLRRLLDGIVTGRGTGELAKKLGVSPARICQMKVDLGEVVKGFFGNALPTWVPAYLEGAR